MAALYSQVGTRSNRQTIGGLEEAISSFQKAAGTNGDRWKNSVVSNRIQQTDVKHHNMPSFVQASSFCAGISEYYTITEAQKCSL